jgi:hypothetical protein
VDHRGLISLPFFEWSRSVHAARLKQHGRRFRVCIFEMLTSARRWRVPGFRGRIHPPNPLPARHRFEVLPQFLDLVRRRSEGGRSQDHNRPVSWVGDTGIEPVTSSV